MSRIEWNKAGERRFEAGLNQGVLYSRSGLGVPWNGLISVDESSDGGELEAYYFEGVKRLDLVLAENFSATIEAFMAPEEFSICDGTKQISPGLFATQQPRRTFGLSYRTLIGNDLEETDLGYKLHLVYNAMAAPASKKNQTISNIQSPITRQWAINTVPPGATTYRPTAHIVVDSTLANSGKLATLENALYGSSSADSTLPTQAQVIAILR